MKHVQIKPFQAAAMALSIASLFVFSDSVMAQPTAPPSAPTYPAGNVIAIYNSSGTYTDITGVNDFESWGGWNGAGLFTAGSAQVLSYFGVNYGGIAGFEGNPQDVSGCTNLFMNVYSPNADSMAIRLVDTSGHSADITYTTASGVITDGSWLNMNFSLAQFQTATPALNLHSIQQIGIICNNPGEDAGNDYYIDNIVFVASTNVIPPPPIPTPTNAAATPVRDPSTVVALYNSSGVYTDQQVDTWDASWSSATLFDFTITNSTAVVLKYLGLQYAGVVIDNNYSRVLNVTNCNYMHVDLWTLNANQFGIQLVSTANGTQAGQVNITPGSGTIVTNQWIGLDIPLNSFTAANGSLDLSQISQMLWIDNQGGGVDGGTFYIDNVYFYSNAVTPPPLPSPTNNAATPARPSAGVLAMYNSSGVYTDVSLQDWDASWSDGSESLYTITNTGANVLHYGGLEYVGAEFGGADTIDASGYNMMHVDVWTPNANQFGVQLVSFDNGGSQAGQVNITPASGTIVSNQWVGLDIPLSSFTAAQPTLDLTNLQQLLWLDNQAGGVTGGIFYVDNVYFYTVATASSPMVTASVSAGTINLTFPTQTGYTYTVLYSTNLTSWQTLSAVSGNNSVQSVPDSIGQGNRFYRVSIQ